MSECYVIVGHCGSWDDSREWVVEVWTEEAAASWALDELTEASAKLCPILSVMSAVRQDAYLEKERSKLRDPFFDYNWQTRTTYRIVKVQLRHGSERGREKS